MISAPFRFNADDHSYHDAQGRVMNITTLLVISGHVDDAWFTEDARDRGTAVHKLAEEIDLGAITLDDVDPQYRGYLLAHREMMRRLDARHEYVEVACQHPTIRLAGRTDRVGTYIGLRGVLDLKTGARHRAHAIQTALQAILWAPTLMLPPNAIARFTGYIKNNGKFKVDRYHNDGDILEAERLIRRYC